MKDTEWLQKRMLRQVLGGDDARGKPGVVDADATGIKASVAIETFRVATQENPQKLCYRPTEIKTLKVVSNAGLN